MTLRTLVTVASFAVIVVACNDPIAQSHVDGNVPSAREFHQLLKRDLQAYFQAAHERVVTVEYQLLRDGPTQTGIAYPKYYAWVRARDTAGPVAEGAVRLAAIDKARFEVTHFLPIEDIRADAGRVDQIFPKPLAETITARAAVRQ